MRNYGVERVITTGGLMNMMLRPAFLVFLILAANHSEAQDVVCSACHTEQTAGAIHEPAKLSCQSCHGGDIMHAASPTTGELRFDVEAATERSAACTTCHGDAHEDEQNTFLSAGQGCNDCHSVHRNASYSSVKAHRSPQSRLWQLLGDAPETVVEPADSGVSDVPRGRPNHETASTDRRLPRASTFMHAERP
jgi:hypothetical protein